MNKLIIITGISGSGKTTLARYLNQTIQNSILLSLDQVKESVADTIGFKNTQQKENLHKLSNQFFTSLLEESMKRKDETISIGHRMEKRISKLFPKIQLQCHHN